jgi:hypothetical protein
MNGKWNLFLWEFWSSNIIAKIQEIEGLELGEATTFTLIVYYVPLHEAHIQMSFCPRTPKWESRNSQSWDSYDFGAP